MKKTTLFKTVLLLCALIVGSLNGWADTTVTIPMNQQGWDDGAIGSGTLKDDKGNATSFNYSSASGEAANAPAYYSSGGDVRFYCKKNGTGNGGSLTITPATESGITITGVVLTATSGYTKATKYNIDGGSDTDLTWASTTGTVSGISASTSFKFRNANKANNTDQLRITQIQITYTVAPSFTITPQSNNESYGTVAMSGSTITATPKSGYRVIAGTGGYTVTSGTATVTNNGDNTFTVTPSTDCTVQINFEAIPSHTLTMAVNNSDYGSASATSTSILESATTTVTATPNDGYRFVDWSVSGTGSSVESTTTNPTTFTMGSADATVTANFEVIPTHTLSSAVTPDESGSVTFGATSVREGSTTSATATPADGYIFKSWAITGTGATLSSTTDNPTEVTMGTANATVTATFAAVYTVTWVVNGQTIKSQNYENNTSLSSEFPEVPSTLGGKAFRGWVTTSTVSADFDEAGLVATASAKSTTNTVTYYAVFATAEGGEESAELTNSEIKTNLTNTTCAYGTEKTYNDTSDGITWVASCWTDAASRPWMQINKDNASAYIKITAPGNITQVKATITSASNSSGGVEDISKHTAFSNTLCLESSAKSSHSSPLASSSTVTDNTVTISTSDAGKTVYVQVTGGAARIWGLNIKYDNITYSSYSTIVPNATINLNASGFATYSSADNFTVTGADAYKMALTISNNEVTGLTGTALSGIIPAGEGILLKGTAGASVTIAFTAEDATADVDDNDLKGTTPASGDAPTPDYSENNYYVLSGDTFKPYTNAASFKANKAYFEVAQGVSLARSFTMTFDDGETTSVADVRGKMSDVRGEYFDLQGRKVAQPTKGLYIVNGRKVVIK